MVRLIVKNSMKSKVSYIHTYCLKHPGLCMLQCKYKFTQFGEPRPSERALFCERRTMFSVCGVHVYEHIAFARSVLGVRMYPCFLRCGVQCKSDTSRSFAS